VPFRSDVLALVARIADRGYPMAIYPAERYLAVRI
jgi:hypothetical protein